MARVQVSDETWATYRAGLGVASVNVSLGELVEREVGRQRRRSAGDVQGARVALEDARSVAQELEMLIGRLEGVLDPGPAATTGDGTPNTPRGRRG